MDGSTKEKVALEVQFRHLRESQPGDQLRIARYTLDRVANVVGECRHSDVKPLRRDLN